MREIKFRVWSRKWEQWLNPEEHVIYADNGDVGEVNDDELVESIVHNTVVEQFTGLHDNNGREIYEGDVVKLHVVILSPDDKAGFIEYRTEFGYCINFGKAVARQEYWAANDKHTIEVIGNIHENPELLEGVDG
ncbi:YopX family protein [Fructobacillus cardui]|uniref:YopX family protein n=1 Tax=Fructobacillus cardui TaxID=2893170 RepID=UPI00200B3FD2|nr:YopX family protein [Fructobacillus cardui]MCK8628191.1 YopX family protein [Fructobacillus cardui]